MIRNYKTQPTSIGDESVRTILQSSDEKLLSMMEEVSQTISGIMSNISQGRSTSVTKHSLPYLSAWLSLAAKELVSRTHDKSSLQGPWGSYMTSYALRD